MSTDLPARTSRHGHASRALMERFTLSSLRMIPIGWRIRASLSPKRETWTTARPTVNPIQHGRPILSYASRPPKPGVKSMSSYWDNNGRYQALHNALWELIPPMGEVANAAGNPALERYRKACKIYRDIFNNGACNYPWG